MRDLRSTVEPGEVDAMARGLWRTPIFRDAHDDPASPLRKIMDTFAATPRLWCELDEPSVERSHFLVWMGVVPMRDEYENPAISDLYYLHEYLHAVSMTHAPDPDRERWAEKIWRNERDASLGSEVFIYFDLPDLRLHTFDFEIWVDRYLADPEMRALHARDPVGFRVHFEQERERAMWRPAPGDTNEALIASYHQINIDWVEIWADRYLEVERFMARFTEDAKADPAAALSRLQQWIQNEQGTALCPFEREARAFAEAVNRLRG